MSIDKIRVRDVICARELWETVIGRGCMGAEGWKDGDTVWHGSG